MKDMYNHRNLYKVICVETREGEGTQENLTRIVKTFYTEDGEFIGVIDPAEAQPQEAIGLALNN